MQKTGDIPEKFFGGSLAFYQNSLYLFGYAMNSNNLKELQN